MRRQTIVTTATCDLCAEPEDDGATHEFILGIYTKGVKGARYWRRIDACEAHAGVIEEIQDALKGTEILKNAAGEPVT
jgi:hypothetical protein